MLVDTGAPTEISLTDWVIVNQLLTERNAFTLR